VHDIVFVEMKFFAVMFLATLLLMAATVMIQAEELCCE